MQLFIIFSGKVSKIGNTSITIYMEARSHNVYTGKQELVLKTNITFVRIDDGGSPIPISERVKNKINKIFEEKVELI